MFCKRATFPLALIALAFFSACRRQPSRPAVERIAILRFENLSSDLSGAGMAADWMGRAFCEVIAAEIRGVPGLYPVPSVRVHAVEAGMGPRPVSAPGISTERTAALGAGATKIVFGQYAIRGGTLEVRMTIEDEITGTMTVLDPVSGPPADILTLATELARQISPHVSSFGTSNPSVLETHVKGFEHIDSPGMAEDLETAIAADPDFGPSYRQLAQLKLQQRDIAGAEAILQKGLARKLPPGERALMQLEVANLHNDPKMRSEAFATMATVDPYNPEVWQGLGAAAMAAHRYPQAVEALRKAVAIQPGDPNLLNQLAYAAAYNGDSATAMNAVDRYQKVLPASPNAADSLGDIDLIAGQLPQAEEAYVRNAKKHPDFYGGLDYLKAALAHLMTGDVPGADALAQQYFDGRAAAKDPAIDYRRAQWAWIGGRRKAACQQMAQLARATETGPARVIALHAYTDLAAWTLMLGDRAAASEMARKAVDIAKPASFLQATMAQFLTQSPAGPAEWQARAKALFPEPAQSAVGNTALAEALLIAKEYAAALPILQGMYDGGSSAADEGLPVLLAWADVETGHIPEAAGLLRSNPPLADAGLTWSTTLYFPRIFYLRAVVADKQNKPDVARENWRIFHALSGRDPLIWGEELKGK